ncbi:MAG: hypothetical protein K8T25_08485 [Planctomycetia bacterium]|nr:hypothetical protein [Planctomycetia bacterium]
MLNEEGVRVDSYQLTDGRRAHRMTYVPTGKYVDDDPSTEESIIYPLRTLRRNLEVEVARHASGNDTE